MQRNRNNAVTTIPILIPADLLPGETTELLDDFHIRYVSYGTPPRKGAPIDNTKKWQEAGTPVLSLKSADIDTNTRIGKKISKQLSKSAKEKLTLLTKLKNAMRTGQIDEAAAFYEELTWHVFGEEDSLRWKERTELEPSKNKRLSMIVAGLITHQLQGARVVLWWNGARLVPAIWCSDLESAVYMLHLSSFHGGKEASVCPHCEQFFVKSRDSQVCCSGAHREAHRVARWRARKKGEMSKTIRRCGCHS